MIYLYPKVVWYSYTLGKLTVVIKPSVKYVPEMLDCKTVGFFLKISKEIGKAWRKSLMRAKRASLTRP